MDCDSVGSLISELYDGEPVSAEAARHIARCRNCRERLRDYSALAAEMRLLAANEREATTMPEIAKDAPAKWGSIFLALRKTMRVPRFAAAACGLVIVLLAGAWAHTRAQNTPPWFAYKLSFDLENRVPASVGGIMQPCGPRCEAPITLSQTEHLAGLIGVQKIEDGKVYLSLRLKRFDSLPDFKHLAEQMADVPATTYVYQPGKVIPIPVTGGGEVEMEGMIVTSQEGIPGWPYFTSQPNENQIVVREGVLIRDGQVIADMPGSGSATGSDAGFYVYAVGQGLFAVGLKPFNGAIAGSVDYGQVRFTENGVKYRMLSGSQITGGDQPRTVWILHVPDYLPSQHDPQANDHYVLFGTSGAIDKTLQGMGVDEQE